MNDVKPSNWISQITQLEDGVAGFRFSGQNIAQVLAPGPFSLINLIFYAIGAFFLLNTVTGGISLMTSAGDPGKINEAKGKITNSIIGFLVAFAAYWIVQLITAIFTPGGRGIFT